MRPGELKVLCAQCLTRLATSTGTDGDGHLVEYVTPCPRCRSRLHPRPAASPKPPKPKQLRTCACGAALEYAGRGRPPVRCSPACAAKRN